MPFDRDLQKTRHSTGVFNGRCRAIGPDKNRGRGLEQNQELPDGGQCSKILRETCVPGGRAAWGSQRFTALNLFSRHETWLMTGTGFVCVCPQENGLLTCDRRARIDGSASFVTGAGSCRCGSRKNIDGEADQGNDG